MVPPLYDQSIMRPIPLHNGVSSLKLAVAQRKFYWTGFGSFYLLGVGDRVWGHLLLRTNFISVLWDFFVFLIKIIGGNSLLDVPYGENCIRPCFYLQHREETLILREDLWCFSVPRFTLSRGEPSDDRLPNRQGPNLRQSGQQGRQCAGLWIDAPLFQSVDRCTSVIRPPGLQATLV